MRRLIMTACIGLLAACSSPNETASKAQEAFEESDAISASSAPVEVDEDPDFQNVQQDDQERMGHRPQ